MNKITPSDSAFNKLYFVNMFSAVKYSSFHEAKVKTNTGTLAKIAEKLSSKELEHLIDKIESIR